MRVSVHAFKQVIVNFLKEFCYSWGFRTTVTKFLAAANKCIKTSNVSSRAEAWPGRRTVQHLWHDGRMVDVLQRRSWQAVSTQYSQRIHLASTGRQQAADVVLWGHVSHVTSSATWPFDTPYATPIEGPLELNLYLQPFSRYCAVSLLRSRVWPFKVTWRHHSSVVQSCDIL